MSEEEDEIVQRIPVYLSHVLGKQLYMYQYPVKPQNCNFDKETVLRSCVKQLNQEVKLEFEMDTNSDYYNISKGEQIALNTDGMPSHLTRHNDKPNAIFRSGVMDKACFKSTKMLSDTEVRKYAVAYMQDQELHCTPLHSVVNMRPDFSYIDKFDKRTKAEEKAENDTDNDEEEAKQVTVRFARTETDKVRQAREKSFGFLSKKSADEPWCDAMFYQKKTNEAELERMRLLCPAQDTAGHALSLEQDQYLRALVPPEVSHGVIPASLPAHAISLNALKMLPLLDQCKLLLKDAKIITFRQLYLLLAQESLTPEQVLRTLPQAGLVVRGNWVARSEVLYPTGSLSGTSGVPADLMCRGRDYVLYLFTENQFVDRRKVAAAVKLPPEEVKEILSSVARLCHNKGWELLVPTDTEFEHKHPDIVQRQQLFWQAKQKQFTEMLNDPTTSKRQRKKSLKE